MDWYGHSMVRYSLRVSSMRPASSISTLMPAVASWNAAMPPAAPLPTTITSQRPLPGLTAAAILRDSSRTAARSRSSVGSAAMDHLGAACADVAAGAAWAFCPQCGQSLPSTVWQPQNSARSWLPL